MTIFGARDGRWFPVASRAMSSHADLVTQLNALLRLTHTEIMIAETRRAQAATADIERELDANADKGRERSQLLARSIHELGGIPDVVGARRRPVRRCGEGHRRTGPETSPSAPR